MNIAHLNQIIDHYLARFEELNDSVHMEYYKWQIAFRFKKLMDDALEASAEAFPKKLYEVKKLTENIIESHTQPFNGLVEFSRKEPETVRQMFRDLFSVSEESAAEKQKAIRCFLDKSIALCDKHFPGSHLYKNTLHSVTGYLFLYDPEQNYLYKPVHCREFADCIEIYDDWGSGADTKLPVFFRMCDEVLSQIKTNGPLMEANAGRYSIDPKGMHPDREKHILLFDLMYCCTAYGLFNGISYVTPKTGERKLMQERKEKAAELADALDEAKKRLAELNDAKAWLSRTIQPNVKIHHKAFGEGTIIQASESSMTVHFKSVGQKTLGPIACVANGLIRFDDEEMQSTALKYKDILRQDEQIRTAVKWAEKELAPYAEYLN